MPEGDTIFRTAERLRPALVGQRIVSLRFVAVRMPELFRAGTKVESVETRGKNLLVCFDSRWVLHTHMKMDGFWRVFPAGTRLPFAERRVRVRLEVEGAIAACVDAPVVRLLRQKELDRDPMLAAVGEDLLDPDFDPASAAARFIALGADRTVADALLDQRGIAGVGNVFRSEILHRMRWSPNRLLGSLSANEVSALIDLSRRLLLENVAPPRPYVAARGKRITREKIVPGESTLAVYGRDQRSCYTCGDTILVREIGSPARVLYFCPRCQAAD